MKKAYTLIEMIAVLLLVGVLVLSATVALVPLAQAFLQVRQNSDAAQKSCFALARITRELTTVTNVVSGTSRSITYDLLDEHGVLRRRTLAWSGVAGTPLTLEGVPLMDDVGSLEFRYFTLPGESALAAWTPQCREIETALGLASVGSSYTLRIRPRNVQNRK